MSDEVRLSIWQSRVEQMQNLLGMTRIKISTQATSLANRCQLYTRYDAMVSKGLFFNPHRDNPDSWIPENPKEISEHELLIWRYSLKDLLQNAKGTHQFKKFLKTEFSYENLYFYERCMELDKTQTKDEFKTHARRIYDEFFHEENLHELNIDANLKATIKRKIETRDIDEFIFTDVLSDIITLMTKDSYPRFVNSPFCSTKE